VVLADPEDIEAHLVGELDLLEQVRQAVRGLIRVPEIGSTPAAAKLSIPSCIGLSGLGREHAGEGAAHA